MSSSKSGLSELSRKESTSMNNQLKEENLLLKTEEKNKNESKKRLKSSGSEALDRQTVNKKLCLRSNSQKRQSFAVRICDDLCEEILQYLSLEDKLKLEGVSKQFQRTVLKKHNELTIDMNNRTNIKEEKYLRIGNIFGYICIDLKSLEILLKKCPNITSIELKKSFGRYDNNQVFRLITKYCNNLCEFDFEGNEINDEYFEEFQRKFGQKINFIHRLKDANNYKLFPNIESLNVSFDRDLKLVLPQLKLKQLTDLRLVVSSGEVHMVKTCVDIFPTLKHFHLQILIFNSESIYSFLDYISNLKHLIDFSIEAFDVNNKLFCDSLKRMANKCQKLISFSLYLRSNSDIRQILSSIKAFPALKRLGLRLYGDIDNNNSFNHRFFSRNSKNSRI